MHTRVNKHDQNGTERWFTSNARRAPHCRRTVAAPVSRSRLTPKHLSRVTCALCALHTITQTNNTIPHKIIHTRLEITVQIYPRINEFYRRRRERARRATRFPFAVPILTAPNRTREQNNNKCAWDARYNMCTWVASQPESTKYYEITFTHQNVSKITTEYLWMQTVVGQLTNIKFYEIRTSLPHSQVSEWLPGKMFEQYNYNTNNYTICKQNTARNTFRK